MFSEAKRIKSPVVEEKFNISNERFEIAMNSNKKNLLYQRSPSNTKVQGLSKNRRESEEKSPNVSQRKNRLQTPFSSSNKERIGKSLLEKT